jgi:hypothetical protein
MIIDRRTRIRVNSKSGEHVSGIKPLRTPLLHRINKVIAEKEILFSLVKLNPTTTQRRNIITPGDEDITPSHTHNDPLLDIQGPITRARACQLNLEVSSFLGNSLYNFENRLLPNDYIVLRNEGEV